MLGLLFSDCCSARLAELTRDRAEAALPFAGRYRMIDFMLSNLVNAGVSDVGIITRQNYRSLMDHLGSFQDWDLSRKNGGLVFLPPYATGGSGRCRGKLEELRFALDYLKGQQDPYVFLAEGSIIGTVDCQSILACHLEQGRDVTVVVAPPAERGGEQAELCFTTKDGQPETAYFHAPLQPGQCRGLGMYLLSRTLLISAVEDAAARGMNNLEQDFIRDCFRQGQISLNLYTAAGPVLYCRTPGEYLQNNLRLLDDTLRETLFPARQPVYTRELDEAPAYFGPMSLVANALIAGGCNVEGAVEQSVLFRNVRVEQGAWIRSSVLLEGAVAEEGAKLEFVVADKGCRITAGVALLGATDNPVVLPKGAVI